MIEPNKVPDRSPKGLMALDGKALAKVVDDVVAALRIVNPTWIGWFGDSLPAQVQQILLESETTAREFAAEMGQPSSSGTGGIMVAYDPEDGQTTVTVQMAAVWDEDEPGAEATRSERDDDGSR